MKSDWFNIFQKQRGETRLTRHPAAWRPALPSDVVPEAAPRTWADRMQSQSICKSAWQGHAAVSLGSLPLSTVSTWS